MREKKDNGMCEFVVGYPDGKSRTPQHKDMCVGLFYAV